MTPKPTYEELEQRVKNLEEKIDRAEQTEIILQATDDFILMCDKHGLPVVFNTAYAKFMKQALGIDIKAGIQPHKMLPDPEKIIWWENQHKRVLAGETFRSEYSHDFGNDNVHHFEISYKPIFDAGKVQGFTEITRDITQRKVTERINEELESQFRHSQKIDAMGTLAGGIAHDFNNILAAIIGYADMALDDIPTHSPSRKCVEKVLQAGRRARELVKQILTFSQKGKEEFSTVQIKLIAKELLKLIRASIPATIEIKQDIDPNCGNILADQTQIHQVLMNLCTNAAQAMDETGGIMEVELKNVKFSNEKEIAGKTLKPGSYVVLSINDTGPGIDPKYMDRIFDPYFTTKENGKGSGIGLAVVHGIIESHGATITVERRPEGGTSFKVFFPEIKTDALPKNEKNQPLPTGNEHVLVIDDEKSMTELISWILGQLHYRVTTCTSSIEALELFDSKPNDFDLVITDQTMPKLTGEQIAKEMKTLRPDIPIIICSGYSTKIDEEQAKKAGASAFVMKPFEREKLALTVREVLNGQNMY